DLALAAAHRVGVTLPFGATTSDSRLAYRRRQDANVERRLADAFHQRQADQIATLLKRAADARARGDYDRGLEALALVATLDPDRTDAARLELACLADKARALEAAQDYASAALVWDRALVAAPADTTAAAGAARCRVESDRRARRNDEIRTLFG